MYICPSGEVAGGLRLGYLLNNLGNPGGLKGIAVRCRSYSTGSYTRQGTAIGDVSGSNTQNLDCPTGKQIIGLTGEYSGQTIAKIGLVCAARRNLTDSTQFSTVSAQPADASAGFRFSRYCTSGGGLLGFKGRSSATYGLSQLEPYCGVRNWRPVYSTLSTAGTVNSTAFGANRVAPQETVMIGLFGNASTAGTSTAYVNHLGGMFVKLDRSNNTLGSTRGALSGLGGYEETSVHRNFFDTCGSNKALVGLKMRSNSGSFVRSITGICADVAGWRNATTTTTTDLSTRGGTGGTLTTYKCAQRSFLVGWEIAADKIANPTTSDYVVAAVRPICAQLP